MAYENGDSNHLYSGNIELDEKISEWLKWDKVSTKKDFHVTL